MKVWVIIIPPTDKEAEPDQRNLGSMLVIELTQLWPFIWNIFVYLLGFKFTLAKQNDGEHKQNVKIKQKERKKPIPDCRLFVFWWEMAVRIWAFWKKQNGKLGAAWKEGNERIRAACLPDENSWREIRAYWDSWWSFREKRQATELKEMQEQCQKQVRIKMAIREKDKLITSFRNKSVLFMELVEQILNEWRQWESRINRKWNIKWKTSLDAAWQYKRERLPQVNTAQLLFAVSAEN